MSLVENTSFRVAQINSRTRGLIIYSSAPGERNLVTSSGCLLRYTDIIIKSHDWSVYGTTQTPQATYQFTLVLSFHVCGMVRRDPIVLKTLVTLSAGSLRPAAGSMNMAVEQRLLLLQ